MVLVIQGQVVNAQLRKCEIRRRKARERSRQLTIERLLAKTADDDGDLNMAHGNSLGMDDNGKNQTVLATVPDHDAQRLP